VIRLHFHLTIISEIKYIIKCHYCSLILYNEHLSIGWRGCFWTRNWKMYAKCQFIKTWRI